MSIQVTTASGALVAFGLGVSDVASIVAIGRRVGNWWTASSGDAEFLSLLGEDSLDVIQRRGLVEVQSFNKRWRKQIQLLANGNPIRLEEKDINQVLDDSRVLLPVSCTLHILETVVNHNKDLSLFTIVMTCIVAVLQQFSKPHHMHAIIHNVLKSLLKLHESGEDVLRAQYKTLLNAWGSTACLRGLSNYADEKRQYLINSNQILSGLIPASECKQVEEFLIWLLSSQSPTFMTNSSDIMGIAVCLAHLGIDILRVEADDMSSSDPGICTVYYSKLPFLHLPSFRSLARIIDREPSIIVPLEHPWEAVSVFPISEDMSNRCRNAWKLGQQAAKAIQIGVQGSDILEEGPARWELSRTRQPIFNTMDIPRRTNIVYALVNRGSEVVRSSTDTYRIALNFHLLMNNEFVNGIQESVKSMPNEAVWFNNMTNPEMNASPSTSISNAELTDQNKINYFCVVQSFLMGYYYDVFGRLVDTNKLVSKTVEGSWGFRSDVFFRYFQSYSLHTGPPESTPHVKTFGRSRLFPLLSMLFLGGHATYSEPSKAELNFRNIGCLGIIGKRSLLINSLLGKCSSPRQVAGFTLLDVDVGGIPRDCHGIVKPGVPTDVTFNDCLKGTESSVTILNDIQEQSPEEDFSFHIEGDWAGDPDTALVCLRYKGRRVMSLSPIPSDHLFCQAFIPPSIDDDSMSLVPRSHLSCGISMDFSAFMHDDISLPFSSDDDIPMIVQALDRPGIRYAATAVFGEHFICKVASDSVKTAEE